ncbi:unnamed protein product [Blepharisma stoltei]|uniref:Transmembrane protein n=1 Tax=Blepharisma stoltei TaxID=1481888 RepID=A0AAU9IVC1_9CILI|nr:unnamed protein product [Blepharisma stoltei]
MSHIYDKIINFFNSEYQRQRAAHASYEKIMENHLLISRSSELDKLKKSEPFMILGGVVVSFLIGFSLSKRWLLRLTITGAGMAIIKGLIHPYYTANTLESLAEKPNDVGQTIRAIYLFKYPEYEKNKHFEDLSRKYRKFIFKKAKESEKENEENYEDEEEEEENN